VKESERLFFFRCKKKINGVVLGSLARERLADNYRVPALARDVRPGDGKVVRALPAAKLSRSKDPAKVDAVGNDDKYVDVF